MAANLLSNEKGQAVFELEIESDKFEESVEKAYKRKGSKINVQGFRKGKAPRKIIEKLYGDDIFYEEAINSAFPDAYDEATGVLGLEPIDRPKIEVIESGKGKNLKLKVTVAVRPEVKLGQYHGIEIPKIEYNVTNEEVEEGARSLAERNARSIPLEEGKVEKGDTVNINFEGFVDEVPFEGGKAEGFDLELGSGQFIPGFEAQVIGNKIGDEFDVNVTFPEEYHSEDLKGKAAVFKVKINSAKHKEIPEVDDEFIKDVTEFETLDAFKADFRKNLEANAEKRAKTEIENLVIDKVIENMEVEVPDVMVDEQISKFAYEMDMNMQSQGLNLQKYFELTNTTLDDFKDQHREQAVAQVKANLAISAIAKQEGTTVSDEEVEEEYKNLAERYKSDIDHVKKYISDQTVRKDLITLKTVDGLVASAKQVDKIEKEDKTEKGDKK